MSEALRMKLNETENNLFRLAKPYLIVMNNDSHTQDVLDLAFRLISKEGGERDIIIPAAILHDVGWSEVPEEMRLEARTPKRDIRLARMHERASVKIAKKILAEAVNDSLQVTEILEIIDGHDTREEALSLNDKIVKDADKLSRYSEIFWDIIRWAGINPKILYRGLESKTEEWFHLPSSREIAHEKLLQRRQEIIEGRSK